MTRDRLRIGGGFGVFAYVPTSFLARLVRRRIAILAVACLGAGIAGPPASAAVPGLANEERHGEAITKAVRAGETRCAELSTADFELIGEYAMGNYLGSVATHSAMNVHMSRTMGEIGDRRMHVALGYRYSGCSDGPASGWIGPVARMMAGERTGGTGPRMMGGAEQEGRGPLPGPTMSPGGHGEIEISTLGGALIALASAALGAGAAALVSRHRGQPRQDAAH